MTVYANRYYHGVERFWYTDMVCEDLIHTYIILRDVDGWAVWDCTDEQSTENGHPLGWKPFSGTLRECKAWLGEHMNTEHREVHHGR